MSEDNVFAISEVMPGKLNALVKNIMRQTGTNDPNEAVRRVNSGEWVVTKPARRFRMEAGVIYFTLPPTDGTTGPKWIERLEKKGVQLSKWAKDVLNSPNFRPTTGVVNNIAVLKGELFTDDNRITSKIRSMAADRKFTKPNAEIACQILEMFTDKEIEDMGLIWIVAMHEPIKDSVGVLDLLFAGRNDDGRRLDASYGGAVDRWFREYGFAFVVPQVSPQA